jgi:hypothetical protein
MPGQHTKPTCREKHTTKPTAEDSTTLLNHCQLKTNLPYHIDVVLACLLRQTLPLPLGPMIQAALPNHHGMAMFHLYSGAGPFEKIRVRLSTIPFAFFYGKRQAPCPCIKKDRPLIRLIKQKLPSPSIITPCLAFFSQVDHWAGMVLYH